MPGTLDSLAPLLAAGVLGLALGWLAALYLGPGRSSRRPTRSSRQSIGSTDSPRQSTAGSPPSTDSSLRQGSDLRAVTRRVSTPAENRPAASRVVQPLPGRTDPLTGLGDRAGLIHGLSEAGGQHSLIWLVTANINRFAEVNRLLGHEAGDRLLIEVAEVLQSCEGAAFRLAGDEFALLSTLGPRELQAEVDRLRVAFAELVAHSDDLTAMGTSVSLGVASWLPSNSPDDPLDVVSRSGLALRLAQADAESVRYFSDEDAAALEYRDAMEQCLRQALAQNALEFVYQPIVRMSDGVVVSVESLSRWHDPVLGTVSPADFIEVAEQTGLLSELSWQSIRAAVDLLVDLDGAAGRGAGDAGESAADVSSISVGVNLSAVQLRRPNFVADLTDLLTSHSIAPHRLTIEVTEGVFIDFGDAAVTTLEELAQRGFGIAIDDFGSGYSSLGYITRLPVTAIKIDRSLATRVDEPRTRSIIAAVLQVSSAHGLKVIVEGVETLANATALADLGAQLCQGWLYSPAVPAGELIATVERVARTGPRVSSPEPTRLAPETGS